MAINIPKIQRNEPSSGVDSIGRTEVDLSGLTNATNKTTDIIADSLTKGLTTYADYQIKKQDKYDKAKADELFNTYTLDAGTDVRKFQKTPDGVDVTPDRIELEKTIKAKKEKYLSTEGLSEGAKAYLNEHINKQDKVFGKEIVYKTVDGMSSWLNKNNEQKIQNLKGSITATAVTTNFDDPKSVALLDEQFKDLKDTVTSPDNPKSRVPTYGAKTVDSTLEFAVSSLTAQGDVVKASKLVERYGEGSSLKPTLIQKITNARKEKDLNEFSLNIRSMPESQARQEIAKIEDDTQRLKAENKYESYLSHERTRKSDLQKRTSQVIDQQLTKDLATGKTWGSAQEFLDDPMYKDPLALMTPAQRRAQVSRVIAGPKETPHEIRDNLETLKSQGKFAEMTDDQFNEAIAGTSKAIRTKFTNEYYKQKNGDLSGKIEGRIVGDVKNNLMGTMFKPVNGKITPEDNRIFRTQIQPFIEQEIQDTIKNPKLTVQERQEHIKKITEKAMIQFKDVKGSKSGSGVSGWLSNYFGKPSSAVAQPAQSQQTETAPKTTKGTDLLEQLGE